MPGDAEQETMRRGLASGQPRATSDVRATIEAGV
jgi:hypothetical protein